MKVENCKRCGAPSNTVGGKLHGDDVTDQGWYCHSCILVFATRRFGVKIRNGRDKKLGPIIRKIVEQ